MSEKLRGTKTVNFKQKQEFQKTSGVKAKIPAILPKFSSNIFKLYQRENSTATERDCEVSLRYSQSIGSGRESNPSRRICNLGAVPLGRVADKNIRLARLLSASLSVG